MNFCFKLVKPFSNIPKKHILLSIEGNIGAGKTTFLRLLKESLKIPFEVVPEPVSDWQRFGDSNNKIELLDLFYKDQRNMRIFERSIYSDKLILSMKFITIIIVPRHIFAINAHNNGFFNEVEWEMYNEWYDF